MREGIRAKKARKKRPQFLRPRDAKTRHSSGPEQPRQARLGSAQRRSVEHAAPPGPIHTGPGSPEQPGAVASGLLLQLMSERVCQDPNISPCPPPFSFSHFLSFFFSSQAWEFQSDIITMIKTDPINTKSYDEYNSNYRGTDN